MMGDEGKQIKGRLLEAHLVGELQVDLANGLCVGGDGLRVQDGEPGVERAVGRQPRQREGHVAQQRAPRQV